jgi:hypothetical protein
LSEATVAGLIADLEFEISKEKAVLDKRFRGGSNKTVTSQSYENVTTPAHFGFSLDCNHAGSKR